MATKYKKNIYINIIKQEGKDIDGRIKPMTEKLHGMLGAVIKFGKKWESGGWILYDEKKHGKKEPVKAKVSNEAAQLIAKQEAEAKAKQEAEVKAKQGNAAPKNPNAQK